MADVNEMCERAMQLYRERMGSLYAREFLESEHFKRIVAAERCHDLWAEFEDFAEQRCQMTGSAAFRVLNSLDLQDQIEEMEADGALDIHSLEDYEAQVARPALRRKIWDLLEQDAESIFCAVCMMIIINDPNLLKMAEGYSLEELDELISTEMYNINGIYKNFLFGILRDANAA